jgi:hypothetical protein
MNYSARNATKERKVYTNGKTVLNDMAPMDTCIFSCIVIFGLLLVISHWALVIGNTGVA